MSFRNNNYDTNFKYTQFNKQSSCKEWCQVERKLWNIMAKKKTSWKVVGMCFCIITHIWVTILILLPKQHVRLPQHILKACMFCKTWQRCGRPDLWLFCLTCNLQVTGTEIRRAHPKETCCKTLIWVHQITSGHNVGVWDA